MNNNGVQEEYHKGNSLSTKKKQTKNKTSTSHVKKTAWMFHNTSLKNLLNLSKGTKVPQHAWR